ncbi:MAG: LytR C-terminal domain-containing protein [Patescibacteria group bacterium]
MNTSASIIPGYTAPIPPGNVTPTQAGSVPATPTVPNTTPATTTVAAPTPPTPTPASPTVPAPKTTNTPPNNKPDNENEVIPLEKKNSKLYRIGIILLMLILASTVSIFYIRTQTQTTIAEKEVNSDPTPKASLAPTPEISSLEKNEISLEILNGTSTKGLAGKTAEKFEKLGYEIKKIGNADDAENHELHVKTEFANQLSKLLKDVKEELEIEEVTEKVDDLSSTARIILGKN